MNKSVQRIRRSSIAGGALALAFLVGIGCSRDRGLELVGTLELTQIEMVAPLSEVIVEVSVDRGQTVEAGQALVRLDPILATADARRADAVLARARKADRVADHDLERARDLRETGVASEQALERAELERAVARAVLREAEAAVDAAQKRVQDLALRAPGAAVVDQLPYEVGERVPAGAVLVVLLLRQRPWIRVWLPEPYLAQVRPETEAEISLDGWPGLLRGRVLEIAREPTFTPHFALTERERAHLVYETRVELLDEPEGVRPGVPATVRLPVALSEETFRIPLFRSESQ